MVASERPVETLVEVQTPQGRRYLVMLDERCIAADLSIRWCKKKSAAYLRGQFKTRGWTASVVTRTTG